MRMSALALNQELMDELVTDQPVAQQGHIV